MSVVGLEQVQSKSTKAAGKSETPLGKDEFLTMLVAQLQHQDPLNPMDSTGFTAQLAQFSSLEQLQNINTSIEKLGSSQAGLKNAQAVNFLGKTVTASGNAVYHRTEGQTDLLFELNQDAAAVYVNLYDARGSLIRSLEPGPLGSGSQRLVWDGKDGQGNAVPSGQYSFEVLAADINEQMVGVSTFTTGKVTGVNFQDGRPYLMAGNLQIPLDNVLQVVESGDEPAAQTH